MSNYQKHLDSVLDKYDFSSPVPIKAVKSIPQNSITIPRDRLEVLRKTVNNREELNSMFDTSKQTTDVNGRTL